MKWINFPTITTILQTNFPISEITFPAVTICSNNKVFSKKLFDTIRDENGPYVKKSNIIILLLSFKLRTFLKIQIFFNPNFSLSGAMEKLKLDEDGLSEALTGALRRYIYYIEERDIEVDIQKKENINQYYLVSNYSRKMPEVLKSVSSRFFSAFGFFDIICQYRMVTNLGLVCSMQNCTLR